VFGYYVYFAEIPNGDTGAQVFSNVSGAQVSITGLAVWLDASDAATLFQDSAGTTPATADNDVIGRWADKSGNGYHATQGTTGNKPLLKTAIQNSKNVIRCDGTDDYLEFTGTALDIFKNVAYGYIFTAYSARQTAATQRTALMFSQGTNNAAARMMLEDGITANRFGFRTRQLDADTVVVVTSSTDHGGTFKVVTLQAEWILGTAKIRQNGAQVGSGSYAGTVNTSNTSSLAARVGQLGSGVIPSTGDHAEYILVARATALSADAITAIETYLNAKWAVF